MMLQNHLLASYVVYILMPNPIIGIPLSFATHFILDLVNYPSEEMEITLQSDLKSPRDRITLAFIFSFELLLSAILLFIMVNKQIINFKLIFYMVAGLIPDM